MAKKKAINTESLEYHPTKVAWATSEFLDKPPPLVTRAFVYLIAAFIIAGIAYSWYSKVAIAVNGRGTITTREPSVPVKAEIPMRVFELRVKEGQTVEEGDILVTGADNIPDQEMTTLRTQHARVIELLEKLKKGRCPECIEELRRSMPDLYDTSAQGQASELLAQARTLLLEFITQEDSYGSIASATRAQRQQIRTAKEKLDSIRAQGPEAERLLALQVEKLNNDIARATSDIATRKQGVEMQITQVRNRLEVHLANLMETIESIRRKQIIRSPAKGVVAQLSVSGSGELLSPGVPLMQVVRFDSGLQANLFIPNKDIPQIEVGMKVQVKLDAFPEREYGAVWGKVETIPSDVVSGGEGAQQSVYEVIVTLDHEFIEKDGVRYDFRLGMTHNSVVVVRYESLLSIGMRKIFSFTEALDL